MSETVTRQIDANANKTYCQTPRSLNNQWFPYRELQSRISFGDECDPASADDKSGLMHMRVLLISHDKAFEFLALQMRASRAICGFGIPAQLFLDRAFSLDFITYEFNLHQGQNFSHVILGHSVSETDV